MPVWSGFGWVGRVLSGSLPACERDAGAGFPALVARKAATAVGECDQGTAIASAARGL